MVLTFVMGCILGIAIGSIFGFLTWYRFGPDITEDEIEHIKNQEDKVNKREEAFEKVINKTKIRLLK